MSNQCPKHQDQYFVINISSNYQGNRLGCASCLISSAQLPNDYMAINSFISQPFDLLRRQFQNPESVKKFISVIDYFEQDLDKKHRDIEHTLDQQLLSIKGLFRQIRFSIKEMKRLVENMKAELQTNLFQDLQEKIQDLGLTPQEMMPKTLNSINQTLNDIIEGELVNENINRIFDDVNEKKSELIDKYLMQTIKIAEKSDDVKKLLNNYGEEFNNILNVWTIEQNQNSRCCEQQQQ